MIIMATIQGISCCKALRERFYPVCEKQMLDDKSFHLFEASMRDKNYEEALRAVHTLKGVCQNLSFTRLFKSSSLVTKALKENDWNKAVDMMPQLSKDYYETINAIEELNNSKEE